MPNSQNKQQPRDIVWGPDEQDWLFRAVIQRSLSGILIFQEEQVVFSNPALRSIVGLREDDLLRMNPFDLVHPEDRDLVRKRAAQRLKGLSPPDDYEFRIIRGDGQTRWMRLLATSIIYRGRPAVLANLLDIDEQKRAHEILQKTDRLRSTLLDTLPHPAMLIRKDHTILVANRHARNLGARVGGLCGNEFGCWVFKSQASGDTESKTNGRDASAAVECRFCRADQAFESEQPKSVRGLEEFDRLWDVFWIPVDSDTCIHYAIDVTEQRRIEQEIRNSELRYGLLADTMSEGLSIQNPQGVITRVNSRLCEITGFAREELVGRPLAELFVTRRGKPDPTATVMGRPGKLEDETFIHHQDGRKIPVTLKIDTLIDDDGNHKGSFAFFVDNLELHMLRRHALTADEFENIVGRERSMRKLFAEIIELGACDFPVLIQGESGVGKELVAHALHNQSYRKDAMFVPVNCAALPEGLLESELFGHVKGAFTGAIRDKKGRFELAHGGTIFLDEVAELSQAMQVKLLRILQDGAFERVGGQQTTTADVRIISATNRNLEQAMKAGRFRRDLYYRLCVMPLLVPPLRERKNDIPLLVKHFIRSIAGRISEEVPLLGPEALVRLMIYDWPGNVRELQNAVQYACVKCKGETIQPKHLPPAIRTLADGTPRRRKRQRKLDPEAVQDALCRTDGNKLQAAKLLGVNRSTLYRTLAEIDSD